MTRILLRCKLSSGSRGEQYTYPTIPSSFMRLYWTTLLTFIKRDVFYLFLLVNLWFWKSHCKSDSQVQTTSASMAMMYNDHLVIGTWVNLSCGSPRGDMWLIRRQIFSGLCMLVIIIRLALRFLWIRKYQADDFLAVVALVSQSFLWYGSC